MPEEKTEAEKDSAANIKDEEATEHGPRGNVHSEKDETGPTDQYAPPPMPN